MLEREVIKTAKDKDGEIVALCNQFKGWSPVSKEEAIKQIESKLYTYFVELTNLGRVHIHVVDGKYLRTDLDRTTRNNLKDLPNC